MSAVRIRECDVVGAVGRLQGGTCSRREGEVEEEGKGEDDAESARVQPQTFELVAVAW